MAYCRRALLGARQGRSSAAAAAAAAVLRGIADMSVTFLEERESGSPCAGFSRPSLRFQQQNRGGNPEDPMTVVSCSTLHFTPVNSKSRQGDVSCVPLQGLDPSKCVSSVFLKGTSVEAAFEGRTRVTAEHFLVASLSSSAGQHRKLSSYI